jgi:hypothetical protein
VPCARGDETEGDGGFGPGDWAAGRGRPLDGAADDPFGSKRQG